MVESKRYSATTVGATSVTLTPTTTQHDEGGDAGGERIFGTGTIVVTQNATPDPTFWRPTAQGITYKITIERM